MCLSNIYIKENLPIAEVIQTVTAEEYKCVSAYEYEYMGKQYELEIIRLKELL